MGVDVKQLVGVVLVGVVLVGVLCGCDDQTPRLGKQSSGTIEPAGGVVELSPVAKVIFPSGTFAEPTLVTVATTRTESMNELWSNAEAMFLTGVRAVYEIRVSVGPTAPAAEPVTIEIDVPTVVGKSSEVGLFALAVEGNDEESMIRLVPVGATPKGDRHLSLTLPSNYFFKTDESGDQHQAVLLLTQPAPDGSGSASASLKKTGVTEQPLEGCPEGVIKLQAPLRTATKRRGFDLALATTIAGVTKGAHPGTDYVAADGTELLAPGNGKVKRVVDSNGKSQNADNGGAGGMVVIDIPGSGAVTYMHLKQGQIKVKAGDEVTAGQVIGLSDTSGFVTGPHLHYEFRPTTGNDRIDPELCIDKGKARVYQGTFQFSQDRTYSSTHTFEALSGTLRFELDYDIPSIPQSSLRAIRHYTLISQTGQVTDYTAANATSACTVASSSSSFDYGELAVFPDSNTYSIHLALSYSASGSCPTNSGPRDFTDALFTELSSDLAADCSIRGTGGTLGPGGQTPGFTEYPLTNPELLNDTYDLTCMDSGTTHRATGRWTLSKVE